MEEFISPRKRSAKDRRISEIRIGDERVRVVGLVIDKKDAELVLDDGSGQIVVAFEDPTIAEGISIGSKVRVFGTPFNAGDALELHAEIVQRVNGLDLELYEEVRREVKKFEKELEQVSGGRG
ncbi:MAG: OB-fold nucleic acid binding domain-containing protein [Hadesarchaea archaeon]|nr:OB-fold nucleic acid binding domain-containing protein [Hadesarchaea archaeon]